MDKKPIIYLAAPYNHDDKFIVENRYVAMNKITAQIINEQDVIIPFSPISYTHRVSNRVPDDFDWYTWDLQFLQRCSGMIVVKLDGWKQSKGVQIETEYCIEHGIPLVHSRPEDILKKCKQIAMFIECQQRNNNAQTIRLS